MHNLVTGALPRIKAVFVWLSDKVAALGSSPAQSAPPADGKGREGSCDSQGWIPSPFVRKNPMLGGYAGRRRVNPLKPLSHKENREVTAIDSRGTEIYLNNTFLKPEF